nr:hypothetical protein [Kibdelosporangium sp. MJ126-NF4]
MRPWSDVACAVMRDSRLRESTTKTGPAHAVDAHGGGRGVAGGRVGTAGWARGTAMA